MHELIIVHVYYDFFFFTLSGGNLYEKKNIKKKFT